MSKSILSIGSGVATGVGVLTVIGVDVGAGVGVPTVIGVDVGTGVGVPTVIGVDVGTGVTAGVVVATGTGVSPELTGSSISSEPLHALNKTPIKVIPVNLYS